MNRYHLNTSIRIVLSLIITIIATGYTVEASQANIQRQLISNARAGNPFNNQQQQPQPVAPIITITPDANTSAINMPILNIGQPAQNLPAQAIPIAASSTPVATNSLNQSAPQALSNTTVTTEKTSNIANQMNSIPILPVGGVQAVPQVSIPTITAPVVNALPIQQIAAQQPVLNTIPVATANTTSANQLGSVQALPLGNGQITQAPIPQVSVVAAPIVQATGPIVSTVNQINPVSTQQLNTVQSAPITPAQVSVVSAPIPVAGNNSANQVNTVQAQALNIPQANQIPTVTASPLVSAPVINTEQSIPVQQVAAQQQPFNNAAPVVIAAPIIPIISADRTPQISSSPSGSLQTLLAPTINAAVESATPAIPGVKASTEQNTQADLSSRIKQLYSSMQKAQNQTFDEATYANFGASLVNTFNEAVEIQSYMIQLLNAAESTPLLNNDQQNYVRQTMLPNLDQIDESTKPLTHVGKSAPAGGTTQRTPASSKKKAKKKKGKKGATTGTAGSTASAGKKKGKKGASTNTDTTGTVTVVPVNTPADNAATPSKKKKKKKGKKAVSATESNAISIEAPTVEAPVVTVP